MAYENYGVFADAMRSPEQGLVQKQWDMMDAAARSAFIQSNPGEYSSMISRGILTPNTQGTVSAFAAPASATQSIAAPVVPSASGVITDPMTGDRFDTFTGNRSIADQTNEAIAQSNVEAGPTAENASLLAEPYVWGDFNTGTVNTPTNTVSANQSNMTIGDYTAGTSPDASLITTNARNTGTGDTNWGIEGLGGTLLGAGQLGLGIASYIDANKTAEKQRELLKQQIASNEEEMKHRKAYRGALNSAFANR